MYKIGAFLILFCLAFVIDGCKNSARQRVVEEVAVKIEADTEEAVEIPFNDALTKIIRDCIVFYDSVTGDSSSFYYVFHLYTPQSPKGCEIAIIAEPYYYIDRVVGYTYIDGRIIVVNKVSSDCGKLLIDYDKLLPYNDTIPDFMNFQDFQYNHPDFYDPHGIEAKVITPDSIVVIKKGML